MRKWSISTLILAATASATLAAQEPHIGAGINLIIPTGGRDRRARALETREGEDTPDDYDNSTDTEQ